MSKTNQKIVVSGLIVEKYMYKNRALNYGISCHRGFNKKHSIPQKKDNSKYNQFRRKQQFIRLVDSNVKAYPKIPLNSVNSTPLTISPVTYYPPVLFGTTYNYHETDISKGKSDTHLLFKKMNEYLGKGDLKYLSVAELQKSGRVHFHNLLFNMPHIHFSVLERLWGKGATNVQRADRIKSLSLYLAKYLTKSFNTRERYQKSFISAHNLKKPITIYNPLQVERISQRLNNNQITYKSSYESFWHGKIDYVRYKTDNPLPIDLTFESAKISV